MFHKMMTSILKRLRHLHYSTPHFEGTNGSFKPGRFVGLANTLVNLEGGSVEIGDNTIFGYNVMLLTGRHDFHEGTRLSLLLKEEYGRWPGHGAEVPRVGNDISIGAGTWVASGVIVLGGVTIGNSVIVAAGAVVHKDVPDFAVVAGVPARVVGDTRQRRRSA